jgi:hypothetical protein
MGVDKRKLVFDLFELSYPVRTQIFVNLQLLEKEDRLVDAYTNPSDRELIRRAILRADNRGLLRDLERAVAEAKPVES